MGLVLDDPTPAPALVGVVLAALFSFGEFGYATGVMSAGVPAMRDEWGLTAIEEALVVTACIGLAAVGAGVGGPCGDAFGRKPTIIVSGLLCVVATVACVAASSPFGLGLGRALVGFGVGLSFTVVPVYCSECVPPEIRGRVVDLGDLSVVSGQLVACLANGFADGDWRLAMALGACPAALLVVVVLVACPESPRWLAKAGRLAEARVALRQVRGRDLVVPDAPDVDVWTSQRVRRALRLGVGLQALTQLAGINAAMYYGGSILMEAGFGERDAVWLSAVLTAAQLGGVCVSLRTIDTLGRRFTLLRSLGCVIPCLVALGAAFALGSTALAVLALLCYLVAFGSGLSGAGYVVNSEIFPLSIRGRATAVGSFAFWAVNTAVAFIFPVAADVLGPQYCFWTFALVATAGFFWLWRYLPETAHKSLEEIDALFEHDPYPLPAWGHKGYYGLSDTTKPHLGILGHTSVLVVDSTNLACDTEPSRVQPEPDFKDEEDAMSDILDKTPLERFNSN
ncbi:hypothetical protein CTAYLR_001766 [Chrysophaeum taylorii]|uniref:Hexose transporter 1 n=1 Tax=Chrysophaeum taylorii TaxID=2483200 RepID=A0AAD7XJ89_9STRA|nr:hypothetical protein CTAYLR_001766 [Chrysophaeum taylorii]